MDVINVHGKKVKIKYSVFT